MTKEETFLDILDTVGDMSVCDREKVAHVWFDWYKDEFATMDLDRQRIVARLYTLVRDHVSSKDKGVKAIHTIYNKYRTDSDAQRLCSAINSVMREYNGSQEHLDFVWRAAALPCKLSEVYGMIPEENRTMDKDRDVYNFLANL